MEKEEEEGKAPLTTEGEKAAPPQMRKALEASHPYFDSDCSRGVSCAKQISLPTLAAFDFDVTSGVGLTDLGGQC